MLEGQKDVEDYTYFCETFTTLSDLLFVLLQQGEEDFA